MDIHIVPDWLKGCLSCWGGLSRSGRLYKRWYFYHRSWHHSKTATGGCREWQCHKTVASGDFGVRARTYPSQMAWSQKTCQSAYVCCELLLLARFPSQKTHFLCNCMQSPQWHIFCWYLVIHQPFYINISNQQADQFTIQSNVQFNVLKLKWKSIAKNHLTST